MIAHDHHPAFPAAPNIKADIDRPSGRPTSIDALCHSRGLLPAWSRGAFIMGHYRGLAQGLALPRAVQAVGGSPGLPLLRPDEPTGPAHGPAKHGGGLFAGAGPRKA